MEDFDKLARWGASMTTPALIGLWLLKDGVASQLAFWIVLALWLISIWIVVAFWVRRRYASRRQRTADLEVALRAAIDAVTSYVSARATGAPDFDPARHDRREHAGPQDYANETVSHYHSELRDPILAVLARTTPLGYSEERHRLAVYNVNTVADVWRAVDDLGQVQRALLEAQKAGRK